MKAVALRTVNWSCNDNLYKCEKGKEVELSASDLEKAKASGLFDIKEEVSKVTPKKTTKKAE